MAVVVVPRVISEQAGIEIVAQLKALITGAPAANFLAAHPPGSIYRTTSTLNPGATYGGTWSLMPSVGEFVWVRTDDGSGDGGTTEQFLMAHPVGSVYESTDSTNPGTMFGGSWSNMPSVESFKWKRNS
ncbi:MAG TPA: hypothetical protein OIM20_07650 [Eggerthellaceae bacterium]|nr:hypothetical protein [Eggerthellaceae bacterium]